MGDSGGSRDRAIQELGGRYLRKKALVLVVDGRRKSEGGSLLEKTEWMLHWLREKQAWVRSKIRFSIGSLHSYKVYTISFPGTFLYR